MPPRHPLIARTDVTSVMLRWGLIGSLATVPTVALVGLALRGERGLLSAVAGAITAVVFLTAGLAVMVPVVRGAGGLLVPAALVVYATMLALLFGVLHRAEGTETLDRTAFTLAAAGATLVWQALLTWSYAHARHLVHDPEEGGRR